MKVRIEMVVPEGLDTSTLLELMQETAKDLHEEYNDDASQSQLNEIEDSVSVEVLS